MITSFFNKINDNAYVDIFIINSFIAEATEHFVGDVIKTDSDYAYSWFHIIQSTAWSGIVTALKLDDNTDNVCWWEL